MGTRGLIHIKDKEGETYCTIYRQYDGYPSGLGKDIFDTLGRRKLVNGIQNTLKEMNGVGCAAALLISSLKGSEAGYVYLYSPNSSNVGEDYTYTVYEKDDQLFIKGITIDEYGSEMDYDGPLCDYFLEGDCCDY